MKTTNKIAKVTSDPKQGTRSVKLSDELHHKCRIVAAQKRMRLQEFIAELVETGLRKKIYADFLTADGSR